MSVVRSSAAIILLLIVLLWSATTNAGTWRYWDRLVSEESSFIDADGCDYLGGIYPLTGKPVFVLQCAEATAPVTVDDDGNRLSLFASTSLNEGGEITATGRDRNYAYIAITDSAGTARVESSNGTRWELDRFNNMVVTDFSDRQVVGYSEVNANQVAPLISRLPMRVLAYSPPELLALGRIVRTMSVDQSTRLQAAVVRKSRLAVPTLGIYENSTNGTNYAKVIAGTEGTITDDMKAGLVNGKPVVGFKRRVGRNRTTWLYRNKRLENVKGYDVVNVDGEIVLRDRRKNCVVATGNQYAPLWGAKPCLEAKVDAGGHVRVVVNDGGRFATRRYRLKRASMVIVDEYLADCSQSTNDCIRRASRRFGRPESLFRILAAKGLQPADTAERYLTNSVLEKIDWRTSLSITSRDGKRRGLLARLGRDKASAALLTVHRWVTNKRLSEAKKRTKIRQIAGDQKYRGLLKPVDTLRWATVIKRFGS